MDFSQLDKDGTEIWISEALLVYVRANCKILETTIRCCNDFMSYAFVGGKISGGIKDKKWYNKIFNVMREHLSMRGCEIYDFTMMKWFKYYSMMLPRLKKNEIIEIDSYQKAIEYGVLKSYFGEKDYLMMSEGESDQFEYRYCDDYYNWVRTFEIEEIVRRYRSWLIRCQQNLSLSKGKYGDPLAFVEKMEKQIPLYVDIIKAIASDKELYIVGDGPGTASIAALMCSRPYFSYEPNPIGEEAVKLGIITQTQKQDSRKSKSVVLLFNVLEYIEFSDYKDDEVIVFSSACEFGDMKFDGMVRPDVYRGHLYTNIKLKKMVGIPRDTSNFAILEKMQPVKPMDGRIREICRDEEIQVSDGGRKVVFGHRENCFSLVDREKPSDVRAKVGSVKRFDGVNFKFCHNGQYVFSSHGCARYSPDSYFTTKILRNYKEMDGLIIGASVSPDQVMFLREDDGALMRLYYIRTIKRGKMKYGVYKYADSVYNKDRMNKNLRDDLKKFNDDDYGD